MLMSSGPPLLRTGNCRNSGKYGPCFYISCCKIRRREVAGKLFMLSQFADHIDAHSGIRHILLISWPKQSTELFLHPQKGPISRISVVQRVMSRYRICTNPPQPCCWNMTRDLQWLQHHRVEDILSRMIWKKTTTYLRPSRVPWSSL